MAPRKWKISKLQKIVKESFSIRQVLSKLGLRPAGGNYVQIDKYIKLHKLSTSHFKGKGWSKGLVGIGKPKIQLDDILVKSSDYQSYKLKKRLFTEKIKTEKCEKCGWAKKSPDGRIPLELDHINGNRHDNRLSNLRILCPNCRSLEPTHRGRNIHKHHAEVAERHTLNT